MVPAAVSCGSSHHLFRRREHHLRRALCPEPNSERWLSWIVVGKPPRLKSAVVGDGFEPFGAHRVAVGQFIDDRVAPHADLRDLDHVARLHEQRRRTLGVDTARLSGNDDVPWQQGNSRP